MSILRVPDPTLGGNQFAVPGWWEGVEDPDRLRREGTTTLLDLVTDDPVASDRTILVVGPVTSLLTEPTSDAIQAWAAGVHALQASAPEPLHLAVSLDPVTTVRQLAVLAADQRWVEPGFEAGIAAALDSGAGRAATDVVPTPSAPGGDHLIHSYAASLVEQIRIKLPEAWLTASLAAEDATASLSRSLDADPEIDPGLARSLRDACRGALAGLEADGVRISGPRDALLWAVPAHAGEIPLDVAADAAFEIMLAQRERPAEPVAATPLAQPIDQVPGRELLTRLRGAR